MTIVDLLALLAAVAAATMGGVAISYSMWVRKSGVRRRWMRWLGPVWAMTAWWYAIIWIVDAIHPSFNQAIWLRPAAWLVFAIPAATLLAALAEDRQDQQNRQTLTVKVAEIERRLNGKP